MLMIGSTLLCYADEDTGWVHPCAKMCDFPVGLNKKVGLMADDCPKDFITELFCTASKEY